MARPPEAADRECMASGRGRRTFVAFACAGALVGAVAPAALCSSARGTTGWIAALESGVRQQLNAIRTAHGLVPLRENAQLATAAEQHSREMADDGYFDHDSADGTSFAQRIGQWYKLGGSWVVGENLLWASPTVGPSA